MDEIERIEKIRRIYKEAKERVFMEEEDRIEKELRKILPKDVTVLVNVYDFNYTYFANIVFFSGIISVQVFDRVRKVMKDLGYELMEIDFRSHGLSFGANKNKGYVVREKISKYLEEMKHEL